MNTTQGDQSMPLSDAQGMVGEFHQKFGHPVALNPVVPSLKRRLFRAKLIKEEMAKELCAALLNGDLPEIADGIGDAIYVLLGTAEECGIDMAPVYEAIHEANMAKGPNGANGKPTK